MFLRDYIDRIFIESSKIPKKRSRIYDPANFYEKEQSSPFQAPKWTVRGYKGSLKAAVEDACSKRSSKEKIPIKDRYVLVVPPELRSRERNKSKSKSRSESYSEFLD
jgi:hypothetical protein